MRATSDLEVQEGGVNDGIYVLALQCVCVCVWVLVSGCLRIPPHPSQSDTLPGSFLCHPLMQSTQTHPPATPALWPATPGRDGADTEGCRGRLWTG